METWYPGARRNPAPTKYWGTYTGGPYRGVLHVTETDSFNPSSTLYGGWHTNYPHFTVIRVLINGRWEVWVYQHIPIDRAARAMRNLSGGVQTNLDGAIQIEIVWHAADAQNMPRDLLDAVGYLMRWIEGQAGVKRKSYDSFHYYLPEGGQHLGTEWWRMPSSVWDNYDGWCGHQHVPENVHGDPGKIDINYLLTVGVPQPVLEDSFMLHSEIVTIPPLETVVENGVSRTRQLQTLKGNLLLADKVTNIAIRTQDFGFITNAEAQKANYAGILVLSFIGLDGKPAGQGNCWVDITYLP